MKVFFHTNGKGFWSSAIRRVRITDMKLNTINDQTGFLRVYFDPKTWDVGQDGLIYTDTAFIKQLRHFLKKHNLEGNVQYLEDISQIYVAFRADPTFIQSWRRKFG